MAIYINQIGYDINGKKHATISGCKEYELIDQEGKVVLRGQAESLSFDESSGEEIALIDFSNVKEAGTYYFKDSAGNCSYHFQIGIKLYEDVAKDALKMFYFQRCGMELEEKYAGKIAHKE